MARSGTFAASGAPVAENQSLKKYVGSAIDVTEHELATQELRRREAYFAEAQMLSHTGSFGWKPDSGEIVWSDETYCIFEYERPEKPTLDLVFQRIHPQDRALAQQVIEGVSRSTDFEHEYRLVMPSGRIKHIRVRAHALPDSSGNIEVIGAVTDITERKTAEDNIRRLVDAGILGIFFANVDGAIVEANQAFLQLLQYDRQDLVSGRLRWADLTPAEWRESDERSMRQFLETGVFHYEKEYFRKDGSRVPVLVGGARLQSANEGVVYVLDLSEQKRAEEKIRRSESYLAEAQRLSQPAVGRIPRPVSPDTGRRNAIACWVRLHSATTVARNDISADSSRRPGRDAGPSRKSHPRQGGFRSGHALRSSHHGNQEHSVHGPCCPRPPRRPS